MTCAQKGGLFCFALAPTPAPVQTHTPAMWGAKTREGPFLWEGAASF